MSDQFPEVDYLRVGVSGRAVSHIKAVSTFNMLSRFAVTIVFLGASVLFGEVGAAQADQSSLQAEASSLASQIESQASSVHQLSVEQSAAQAQYTYLSSLISSSAGVVQDQQALVQSLKDHLSSAAIGEYISGAGASTLAAIVTSTLQDYLLRADYQGVAGGSVSDLIASYNESVFLLKQKEVALQSQRNQALTQLQTLASASASLRAEVQSEHSTLAKVNGQIQTLVQAALARQFQKSTVQGLPTASGLGLSGGVSVTSSVSAALAGIRRCESGGNYSDNTGNGYYGAYQFSESTWLGLGFSGLPSSAAPSVQDLAAAKLAQRSGWGQWPACATMLGLI